MQVPSALGIALLGLVSASIPSASEPSSPPPAPENRARPKPADPSEVRVIENEHRWYNQRWNELFALDGEWEELAVGQRSVLRPLGEDCTIGIRPSWKDEFLYFPMTRKGEVVIDGDWIRINQREQSRLSAGEGAPATNAHGTATGDLGAPLVQSCDWSTGIESVVEVVLDGTCWQEAPPSGGCSSAQACTNPGEFGCTLDVVMNQNARASSTSFEVECGGTLLVSTCTDEQGKQTVCVQFD